MISYIVALSAVLPPALTSAEAERVYDRLCQTPTAQTSRNNHPLTIKPTAREEVALAYPDGVTISEGYLRKHSEAEVAWALARHLGARVRSVAGGESDTRTGLRIYKEAGYDPFLPAAGANRQIEYLRRICPDWQLGALALELTYGSETYPTFTGPIYRSTPTTGTVEHKWRYDDPAWTEWFARETGRPRPSIKNRFPEGQCTALAYAIRPDFPFDPRGGGRNAAKNWPSIAKAAGQIVTSQPSYLAIGVQGATPGNPDGHVFICLGQTSNGRIRGIDCNFGTQPDGWVRVRTFDPDAKILGYIPVPRADRYEGNYGYPLRPNRTSLTTSFPYWHAAFDGRAMFRSAYPESWWLNLRIRAIGKRQHDVRIWVVTSIGQSHEMTTTIEDKWESYEIGPISWGGGRDIIQPHIVHSIAMVMQTANGTIVPCEVADCRVIMRGP